MHEQPEYTSDEFRGLLRSLQRYADEELDQFAHWRMQSKYGDVFITVSRKPEPGADARAYDLVTADMPLRDDRD